jgi:hypothetical protein
MQRLTKLYSLLLFERFQIKGKKGIFYVKGFKTEKIAGSTVYVGIEYADIKTGKTFVTDTDYDVIKFTSGTGPLKESKESALDILDNDKTLSKKQKEAVHADFMTILGSSGGKTVSSPEMIKAMSKLISKAK